MCTVGELEVEAVLYDTLDNKVLCWYKYRWVLSLHVHKRVRVGKGIVRALERRRTAPCTEPPGCLERNATVDAEGEGAYYCAQHGHKGGSGPEETTAAAWLTVGYVLLVSPPAWDLRPRKRFASISARAHEFGHVRSQLLTGARDGAVSVVAGCS